MRILPTVLSLTILSITTLAGYALISSPIEPAAYQPSAAPELTGRLNPNQALMQAELLAAGQIKGPEDVDEDAQGRVYARSEEHTSELQSRENLVCRLLLEKKKKNLTDAVENKP